MQNFTLEMQRKTAHDFGNARWMQVSSTILRNV